MYCWPMNIAPMSAPNTMIPATPATQNVGRAAIFRSYSGFGARRWRMTNRMPATSAITSSPIAVARMSPSGITLIASTNDPTRITDRMPPRLSTGSVPSFTCDGTLRIARNSATSASGMTMKNTHGQSAMLRMIPDSSGPETEIAPPTAAHRAIALVRPGPGPHSAAMRARVVG